MLAACKGRKNERFHIDIYSYVTFIHYPSSYMWLEDHYACIHWMNYGKLFCIVSQFIQQSYVCC